MHAESSKVSDGIGGANTQSMGKGIVIRLEKLRASLVENCRSASAVADNIVGCTPANTIGAPEKDHQAGCFLETIERIVCDMERISCETRDHLSRLNRAF